jgi:hypothetical protein
MNRALLGEITMLLRFPALYRFLGLVAFGVPAAVLACTTETTSTGSGDPAPVVSPTTTSSTDPAPTTTTTAPTPPKDAGVDAAKDAAPPPTDVADSAECKAYCAKMKSQCNSTCIPKTDCAIKSGQCAASTRDYLDCETTQGQWYCGSGGFSIVSSCTRDTSLCN